MAESEPDTLSLRHRAICRLLVEGRRPGEVARALRCSRRTVHRVCRSEQGRQEIDRLVLEAEAALRRSSAMVPLIQAGLVRLP